MDIAVCSRGSEKIQRIGCFYFFDNYVGGAKLWEKIVFVVSARNNLTFAMELTEDAYGFAAANDQRKRVVSIPIIKSTSNSLEILLIIPQTKKTIRIWREQSLRSMQRVRMVYIKY